MNNPAPVTDSTPTSQRYELAIWGPDADRVADRLQAHSSKWRLHSLGDAFDPRAAIQAACLIISVEESAEHEDILQQVSEVRSVRSDVPIVILAPASANPAGERTSQKLTEWVTRSNETIPVVNLSATCNRLVNVRERPPQHTPGENTHSSRSWLFVGVWILAVLMYGLGDTVSTIFAVDYVPWLNEANPVVDAILAQFGVIGYVGAKVAIFLLAFGISIRGAAQDDHFRSLGIPLFIAILGAILTIWNILIIVLTIPPA